MTKQKPERGKLEKMLNDMKEQSGKENIYKSFTRAIDSGNYSEAVRLAGEMPEKNTHNHLEQDDAMRHLIKHSPGKSREGVFAKTSILKERGYAMHALDAAIDGFEANPQDKALHDFAEDFAEKIADSLSVRERKEFDARIIDMYYFERDLEESRKYVSQLTPAFYDENYESARRVFSKAESETKNSKMALEMLLNFTIEEVSKEPTRKGIYFAKEMFQKYGFGLSSESCIKSKLDAVEQDFRQNNQR